MTESSSPEKVHPIFTDSKYETPSPIDRDNPTEAELEKRIIANGGKIPYSEFMDVSLYGDDGYYSTGKVEIGKEKDFITCPEASELFGASMIPVLVKTWEEMGKPEKFQVVEMGAGYGAMAASILKWGKEFNPEFAESIQYTIVEYAQGLIPEQRKRLEQFDNISFVQGSAYELPLGGVKGALISNELPDAFPVERVTRLDGKIKQKYITISDRNNWTEVWDEPSPEVLAFIKKHNLQVQDGIEEPVNIKALEFQKRLDQALEQGIILTIDYGKDGPVGERKATAVRSFGRRRGKYGIFRKDHFQAYSDPGEVDITSSIDFNLLEAQSIKDGLTTAFSGLQPDFLKQAGIKTIAIKMLDKARSTKSWEELVDISRSIAGYETLMDQARKGDFYVLMNQKGVNVKDFGLAVSDLDVIVPFQIPIKLPEDRNIFHLQFTNLGDEGEHGTNMAVSDGGGKMWILPHLVKGLKVLDDKENVLVDLSDEDKLKRVIKEAGYQIEVS